jgi:endo-1,4-beta-xylanase
MEIILMKPEELMQHTDSDTIRHVTFTSASAQAEYEFFISLPPSYHQQPHRRYPVLYWLPGRNADSRSVAELLLTQLEKEIPQENVPEMILIVPANPQESMYCDSKDGEQPVETILINELVPHVDATYRTCAERQGRAIGGHSMGGFGAARLGFKYPHMFGAVSMLSPAFHTTEEFQQEHATDIFANVFGSDIAYCQANIPETLVEQNADMIREHIAIRLCIGERDRFLLARSIRFHDQLRRLDIDHQFVIIRDAGHDVKDILTKWNSNPYRFYARVFQKYQQER